MSIFITHEELKAASEFSDRVSDFLDRHEPTSTGLSVVLGSLAIAAANAKHAGLEADVFHALVDLIWAKTVPAPIAPTQSNH